ncbi:hypothetical protein Tco_0966787 [Tanacetum coccineum]
MHRCALCTPSWKVESVIVSVEDKITRSYYLDVRRLAVTGVDKGPSVARSADASRDYIPFLNARGVVFSSSYDSQSRQLRIMRYVYESLQGGDRGLSAPTDSGPRSWEFVCDGVDRGGEIALGRGDMVVLSGTIVG